MAIEVLEDKLAIIPLADPDMIGSIYIPDKAKQRIDQGIVKYKGPKVKEVFVGAHVLFSGYSGDKIAVEDEGELYIMQEEDIICILNDEEATVVFPLSKVLSLISYVEIDILVKGIGVAIDPEEAKIVRNYTELLKARFSDIFFAEGLQF